MIILPAIDLYGGKAVRLYQGDYEKMTVYSHDPISLAKTMQAAGAEWLHLVDLEGARFGTRPHLSFVSEICEKTALSAEIGGGVRTMEAIADYLAAGAARVILGTSAATDPAFLEKAVSRYGERIAVGADFKDGAVAVRGWLEKTGEAPETFLERVEKLGVKTVICTDISRDGAMRGSNLELYRSLSGRFSFHLIASGGVSSAKEIARLKEAGVYGAILGRAYYENALSIPEALEAAK